VGQAARLVIRQSLRKLGFAAVTAGVSIATLLPLQVLATPQTAVSVSSVQLAALPPEAQVTARLIRAGGPFPHAKDGSVFGNRERLLPRKPRGYYREYTVDTPSAHDRGARRIVCGGEPPTRPEACYYTGDHYASFQFIAQ